MIYPLTLEDLIGEIWKDVRDYEGLYKISNFGRVKSLKGRWGEAKIRKPQVHEQGYLIVQLYKDGRGKNFLVHRLVAEAFIPNPNDLPEVDHIDTNKFNCRVSNLRWATRSENEKYAYETGAKKSARAKLTNEQVLYIRENPNGLDTYQLAEKFGVCRQTISYAQRGQLYKNVGGKIRKAQKRNYLTEDQRAEVRKLYKPRDKDFGARALARKYGVCPVTIWNIVKGEPK